VAQYLLGQVLTSAEMNDTPQVLDLDGGGVTSTPLLLNVEAASIPSYTNGGSTVTYPTAFPNATVGVLFTDTGTTPAIHFGLVSKNASGFTFKAYNVETGAECITGVTLTFEYLALGQ
jgi:hypothetical protein